MIKPKEYLISIFMQEVTEVSADLPLALEKITKEIEQGFTSGSDVNLSWEVTEDE